MMNLAEFINIENRNAVEDVVGYTATDYTNYDQKTFPRYLTTKTLESGSVSTGSYIEKEDYFDGLNRTIRTVADGKNENGADEEIITTTDYDEMGRVETLEGAVFFN